MGDLDIDGDGTIDANEAAIFLSLYNSLLHDYRSIKKMMIFLCAILVFLVLVVLATVIPLGLIAVEVAHDNSYHMIAKDGSPLYIRQSVSEGDFDCSPDAIVALQWLMLSPTEKVAVVSVFVKTYNDSSLAVVRTAEGEVLKIPCVSSKKRSSTAVPSTTQTAVWESGSCPSGRFFNNGTCNLCPDGSWSGPGSQFCEACYQSCLTCYGASPSQCLSCNDELGRILDANSCICKLGFLELGAPACQACPAGTQRNLTQQDCEACPAGWISSAGSSDCAKCPTGTSAYVSQCLERCPAGTYATVDQMCLQCPEGQISLAGATACTLCSPGSIASEDATSCLVIPFQPLP